MIGSLVVMLPSSATGGELVVGQGDDAVSYRGLKSSLVLVAFYGDTVHEVRPVRTGHRVVLTYNLLLAGEEHASAFDDTGAVDALVPLLDDHFTQPTDLPSWRRSEKAPEPPDRLVYLLDHGYTSRGLNWRSLKGADGHRARLLQAAAGRLDLEVVLTQAKVNETWSAIEDWDYGSRRGGRRGRNGCDPAYDDGADAPDDDSYQLEELLDSSVELLPVKGVRLERWVDDSELCESTPSLHLTPDGSRYEGYMGNYGNTLDRWYQRAAMVLWPRSQSFVVRAKGDPIGAVAEILDDAANWRASVAAKIGALAPRWGELFRLQRTDPESPDHEEAEVAGAVLAVAKLAEHDDAARLLSPLSVTALTTAQAGALVAVVDRFGLPWAKDWLYEWTATDAPVGFGRRSRWNHRPTPTSPVAWVCELPEFCRAVMEQEESSAGAVGATLATAAATWVLGAISSAAGQPTPSSRKDDLTTLGPAVRAVLAAADIVDVPDIGVAVTEALCEPDANPPTLPCLVAAVGSEDKGRGKRPETAPGQSGLAVIATFCLGQLETRQSEPRRAEDDWAIAVPTPWPDSDDAATLAEFLSDSERQRYVWPLAKPRRQAMHQILDRCELPVSHVTERSGSPHKLVLTKTDELFARERAERAQDEADLAQLTAWLATT